jgi:uncharacterized protein YggE
MGDDPSGDRTSGPAARKAWPAIGAATVVVLAGAVAAGVSLAARSGPATAVDPPTCGSAPRLTVQGSGLATGTPDLLTLSADVNVTDATAQAALADDNSRTAAVLAALKAAGAAPADLQTTGLSVQPTYVTRDGTLVLAGYTVDNTVVAKLRDFGTAGASVDAVVGAAGNAAHIDSLTFSIADARPLEDQARQDAVRQAVSHAGAMAAAAGERLGPVCSMVDDSSISPGPTYHGLSPLASSSAGAPDVPLQPGTQQASAQVTIVYALRPSAAEK